MHLKACDHRTASRVEVYVAGVEVAVGDAHGVHGLEPSARLSAPLRGDVTQKSVCVCVCVCGRDVTQKSGNLLRRTDYSQNEQIETNCL